MACNCQKREHRCPICGGNMTYDKNSKCYTCKQHRNTVMLHPNFFKYITSTIEIVKIKRVGEIDANNLKTEREYLDEQE